MRRGPVLYVITRSEVGGAQLHLLELLRAVSRLTETHLVTGEEGFLTTRARLLGVPTTVIPALVPGPAFHRDIAALAALEGIINRLRPVLVHAHSTKAGFLTRLAAHRNNVPCIFTVHGWAFTDGVPALRQRLALLAERIAARWTSIFILVSEADRRLAQRYQVGTPSQWRVVRNGVPDDPRRAAPAAGHVARLAMVARFCSQKDHRQLLLALSRLTDLPWQLELAGHGPRFPRTVALARHLGLAGRVRFHGVCDDVAQLLSRCQAFVLASRWEGLPLAILEAMRSGLPVIASDVGGVGEAVIHGMNGLLVPRGDAQSMAAALAQLLSDRDLRQAMGHSGRLLYEQEFTADRMIRQTLEIYDEVLGSSWQRQVVPQSLRA